MTPRYRLSQRAVDDLGEIWDFIAADDPLAADAFIARLLDVIERVADAPRIGRGRDDLIPGLRSIPHGNYLIFYLHPRGKIVEVARIVHGGRELGSLFRTK